LHKTILPKFCEVTVRKKIRPGVESLQRDLDDGLVYDDSERTYQGKLCRGRTPRETPDDGKRIRKEKKITWTVD
tara:strand:- start:1409 stop:1630 length:222 start_codon:yes stop_codon:yes gene_type:complete